MVVGFEVQTAGLREGGGHRRDLRCETTKSRTEGEPPMALSQTALSELLETFRTGDGVDMIRESVGTVLQELVEVEAAAVIGADRYERTADRVTERNSSTASSARACRIATMFPRMVKASTCEFSSIVCAAASSTIRVIAWPPRPVGLRLVQPGAAAGTDNETQVPYAARESPHHRSDAADPTSVPVPVRGSSN